MYIPSLQLNVDVSFSLSLYVYELLDAMMELLQYYEKPIIPYVCLFYYQEAHYILNRNECIRDIGIIQGDHFILF